MNKIFFWGIILVCWIFIFINYIRKPQETKNNYSSFWFVLKSLWEKRKTSGTYRKFSLGCFVWIFLCLFMRYAMITAHSQHNSGFVVVSLILLVTLPLLALILIIYGSYKIYRASKEALANKKNTLTQTKTPFVVYLCDLVYVLVFLSPYYARLIK